MRVAARELSARTSHDTHPTVDVSLEVFFNVSAATINLPHLFSRLLSTVHWENLGEGSIDNFNRMIGFKFLSFRFLILDHYTKEAKYRAQKAQPFCQMIEARLPMLKEKGKLRFYDKQ